MNGVHLLSSALTGHYSVKGTLAWMEVDSLSVVDTTPRGTLVFIR